MRATGIIRRVDVLGRVVVPKEIRKVLKIDEGDPLEIFTDKDGIILKKYSPITNMDGLADDVCKALARQTAKCVYVTDKDSFVAASGNCPKQAVFSGISSEIYKLIVNKQTVISSYDEGGAPLPLSDGEPCDFTNQLVMPVIANDEGVGCIIIGDKSKENKISSNDIELVSFACEVLASRY
ncbi:MAG: AbrB/MazE/SpoVT family DNA-binding domain-containing protein [Clostridia bacterium]|nr:AbrB/MazE/SpoVT family DNA-binding domain-containing protein [Clostridia bacterium]